MTKFGVVIFPGSNCDADCLHVLRDVVKVPTDALWHDNSISEKYDAIVLPGGFSYGDYLRTGAIAKFSPVMKSISELAKKGIPIIGICNGFQILCEANLLPGALLKNKSLSFICKDVYIKTQNKNTPFTILAKDITNIPIAHGEGNFFTDENTLKMLQDENRIVFQYCDENGEINTASNPNGSLLNIAGICSKEKNVVGMMPHPERCSEKELGGTDGLLIFKSVMQYIVNL